MPSTVDKFGKSFAFVTRTCALAALVQLGACAAPAAGEDGTSTACEVDPELVSQPSGLRAQRLSANSGYMNGIQSNGIQANGIQTNGQNLNGVSLNGVQLNAGYINGVRLSGSELVGVDREGRVVSGAAFVGAKIPALLSDGTTIELVVRSFERSAADPDVIYYELEHEGRGLCADGVKGMFVPGVWDEHGARRDATTIGGATATASYSCATGVIAKCVTWGYAPWRVGAAMHQTCTRMARADYCGSGVSYTKNGTPIDVYDVAGVQAPTNDPELLFEAGWNEDGAVCVSRTRYDARTATGEPILPSCWASLPKCESDGEAKALGALVLNASRPQTRLICRAGEGK